MPYNNYTSLSDHYKQMIELFDHVHFNSSVSEEVYRSNVNIANSTTISVTHNDISDNRVVRAFDDPLLHLTFIGSATNYKGLPMLIGVLDELLNDGFTNWTIDVWQASENRCYFNNLSSRVRDKIRFKGCFSHSESPHVFKKDCLLVIPSICYETFGLVALEALSFGVPVMVSSTVGAKDVVGGYDNWFIYQSKGELKDKIKVLIGDKSRLKEYNSNVVASPWSYSLEEHSHDITKLYSSI